MTPQPVWSDLVPTLTDGVVTLRAHRDADLARIVEQCTDPDSQAYLPLPCPYGPAQAQEFLDQVAEQWAQPWGKREWAITDAGDRFLGSVNLHHRSATRAEVGFGLHPAGRGRGLAARAVRLALEYAAADGVQVLRWRARAGNWASRRVAWACGFDAPVTLGAAYVGPDGRIEDEWHASRPVARPAQPQHRWLTAPELLGSRIRLRPLTADDALALPPQLDPQAGRFMVGGMPTRVTFPDWYAARREDAARGRGLSWAITDLTDDRLRGAVVLAGLDHRPHARRVTQLGYWLLADARGQGFARAAIELVAAHALAPVADGGLGAGRLSAHVDVDNVASARTLRAAGFVHSGTERAAYDHGDRPPTDALVFQLCRGDDVAAQRISPLATPALRTARFRLRPFSAQDTPPADPDPIALRFVPRRALPTVAGWPAWLAARERMADEGEAIHWCIADLATDECLGAILLFRLDPADRYQAEVGYWLYPSARGRGAMAEVLPAVLAHAFAPVEAGGLGLTRVHAGIDSDNPASARVLLAAGMREWGRDRQAFRRNDGTLSDGIYFEALATDAARDEAQ